MKPQVAKFSKDSPVTVKDIWNTFRVPRRFKSVQVAEAEAQIGAHAPRYWVQKGWLGKHTNSKGALVYTLTEDGANWIMDKIERYIANHPDQKDQIVHLPRSISNKL